MPNHKLGIAKLIKYTTVCTTEALIKNIRRGYTMKTLVFLIILSTATVSQAANRNIYCDGGSQAFTANLIEDHDTPGYFQLQNAKINGAFTRTEFICAGNTQFMKMKCAGYRDGISSKLIELSFIDHNPNFALSLRSFANDETKSWPCVIE